MYDCVVIGAGLAGSSAAYSLAKRGKRILILEKEDRASNRASNNNYAILSPYLTNNHSSLAQIYSRGFVFAQNLLKKFPQTYRLCGAVQFPSTPRIKRIFEAQEKSKLNSEQIEKELGFSAKEPAFLIDETCVVDLPILVNELIAQSKAELRCSVEVESILKINSGWQIIGKNGEIIADQVKDIVIASAHEAKKIREVSEIPLEPVRGEIWKIKADNLSQTPKKVFLFGGYLTPPKENYVAFGGSFKHRDLSTETNRKEFEKLVKQAELFAPNLFKKTLQASSSWVEFRTSTHDRLPYIGSVLDFEKIYKEASAFRSGSNIKKLVPQHIQQGLWVSLGHGSRGLTTCPMAGEIVARMICNEEMSEFQEIIELVSPIRLL